MDIFVFCVVKMLLRLNLSNIYSQIYIYIYKQNKLQNILIQGFISNEEYFQGHCNISSN